jgi:hypothetical protein
MMMIWVARSAMASRKLSFADSPSPRMLTAASSPITASPPITSPGE